MDYAAVSQACKRYEENIKNRSEGIRSRITEVLNIET
jgi:hypothetical protein